ncbi:MAG TPA: hypothetical protein VFZ59_07890 [Verrucomicrobiae bacterium]|nr:hypothetical protein [Verrucomicrobiae bacterium]
MIHGFDTSFLVAVEVSSHEDHAACRSRLQEHKLGRKRLLDTMLASTMQGSGITSVLTLNRDDFRVFGGFTFPK